MRSKLLISYGFVLAAALFACLARPVAFQKANAVVPASAIEPVRSHGSLDVERRIRAIPYRGEADTVWAVEPRARYRETIGRGQGNCSNLAFGLAYELDRRGLDYQIIHLLPQDFMSGAGHTVVRTRFRYGGREQVGVIDVLEGGLPSSHGRPLDAPDLAEGPVAAFSLVSLNSAQDTASTYYGDFLRDARVGYIPSSEVREYFRFIEEVYVPLGNARVEKYLYDGLAVVAGAYPKIHVPAYADLFAGRQAERAGWVAACWLLRSVFLVGPAYLILRFLESLSVALRRAATDPLPERSR